MKIFLCREAIISSSGGFVNCFVGAIDKKKKDLTNLLSLGTV